MTDNSKEIIKSYLTDYLNRITGMKGNKYICPACHSGDKNNGTPAFNIIPNSNNTAFKCHSCGIKGDIFDLYSIVNNTDLKTAFNDLQELYNGCKISTIQPIQSVKEQPADYTEFFIKAHSDLNKCDYLLKRGISAQIQNRFNIGYAENWKHPKAPNAPATPRIIIPTSKYSYLARDTRQIIPENQKQYNKSKVGETHIFNIADIEKEFCFVAEGEIDAMSIIQCGFNCIALGSVSMINSLLRYCMNNKSKVGTLIFALDNDNAGRTAAEKITEFQKIGIRCISANISGNAKDPNDLLIKSPAELVNNLNNAVEQAKQTDFSFKDSSVPAQNFSNNDTEKYPPYMFAGDDGKIKVITSLLAEYIRNNSKYIFVRSDAREQKPTRYWYSSGAYREITDDELKGIIKEHITRYDMLALKMRTVEETFRDITTDRKFIDHNKLNADENIINFENGLLYLDTMELKPHSPDVLSTIQIPCKWTGSAGSTPVFDKFMNDFTAGDEEVKRFLLQYMGMCISNVSGYYPKKALFIVGAGNSGKTQLLKLTIRLLGGKENCEASSLEKLESRFGAADIENKRLTYNPDMTYATLKELAIFKQITGGDFLRSEAKYKSAHSFLYRGLLWFCTNKLPKFGGDRGQWVYDRMIILKADNVIPEEKRDKLLLDKMYAERENIIYKAVTALKEVIRNGFRYNIPKCCTDNMKQYQQDNSPVLTFFNECCIMREQENGKKIKDNCTTKKMYEVFKAWCKDNNGGYIISKTDFNKEIMMIFNADDIKQIQQKIQGIWYYIFTLNIATKADYQSVYGVDNINL
ncbi:MAG: phage/plasmid primase, P4 family [Oscillospiraceae bacterium]